MALTKAFIENAQHAKQYFERHLNDAVDYYGKTVGVWQGKGAAMLGLSSEVTKGAFGRIVDNLHPLTGQRLSARMNGTRMEQGWKLNEQTHRWEWAEWEVENRRVGIDLTWSIPKSASLYYKLTGDQEILQAARETNAEMVRWVMGDLKVRVRVNGADHDRESGIGLCATFLHETARPVSGEVDPHLHFHNVFSNHAFDPVEQRWKAAEFCQVLSNEWRYRAKAEALFASKLIALGHGIRKTAAGIDMQVITPEEVRLFSKRSAQLEEAERTLRPELERRADAAVHAAAARGEALDPETAYKAERAKLAAEQRQLKAKARLAGKALEDDWKAQLAPGRLQEITRERSQALHCAGLVDAEKAKTHAIRHCFENQSVAKESELIIEALRTGIGRLSPEEAEAFVKDDLRLRKSLAHPGKLTTLEVYREDLRILQTVQAGLGKFEPLGRGREWQVRDQKILGDAGQLGAVGHILGSRDSVTAVAGLPGAGKTTMIVETAAALRELTGSGPVMLAVSGSAVDTLLEKGLEARTLADFRVNRSFQETVAGRVLWVDEASLVSNQDFLWLLGFANRNHCRLILSGDPQQHEAVQRGQPFKLLIDRVVLQPAWLDKIYRQRGAPELEALVRELHALNHAQAFFRMRRQDVYREFDGREEAMAGLVGDVIAEKKAGRNPLVIAPVHRDGEAFAVALSERMRQEGLMGQERYELTRLDPLNLTLARRQDWSCYRPGQVVEFHRPASGGFCPGQQWRVIESNDQGVRVQRKGCQKLLPLEQAERWRVYEPKALEVSVGSSLQVTRKTADLRTGEVREIRSIEGNKVVLDDGRKLDASKALHVRQGHSVTSQVSQSKERQKMFALALTSALPQLTEIMSLVSVSRAQEEARVYTDSVDAFEAAVARLIGHRLSAIEFVEGRELGHQQCQEAARTREVPERHDDPTEACKRQRSQSYSHGMSL